MKFRGYRSVRRRTIGRTFYFVNVMRPFETSRVSFGTSVKVDQKPFSSRGTLDVQKQLLSIERISETLREWERRFWPLLHEAVVAPLHHSRVLRSEGEKLRSSLEIHWFL